MKYLILMAEDEAVWPSLSADEQNEYLVAHNAFSAAVAACGTIVAGEALDSVATATTLRHVDGTAELTDGPFAETAEQVGGFYLIDVADLDAAVAVCKLLPHQYAIEIRPVIDFELPELP